MSHVKKSKAGHGGSRRENVTARGSKQRVLAERNEAVAAVGAWVESGEDCQQHPAVLASVTEEQLVELRRAKEESLRRFQAEVRRRVAQQAWVRKRQQLQKSHETVEHEAWALRQSSDTAQGHKPNRSCFLQGQLAIGSSDSHRVSGQELRSAQGEGSTINGKQHGHQLSKVMKQVRRKLASCQMVKAGEELPELPGGIWKASPTRHELPSHDKLLEETEDEIFLYGQHDRPLDLQYPGGEDGRSKTVTFQNIPIYGSLPREPNPTGPSPSFSTDHRAMQVLWPCEDQEELKRQRQSQFLMNRRLFMDIERAQVQVIHRHRKHLKRIERIKSEKEQWRLEEERRMQRLQEMKEDRQTAESERQVLEHLRLEEQQMLEDIERKNKARKDLEAARFIEALRAQMKEKIMQEKVDLPPLCCCGESFWDSHPDTCANNCVFYNNPKAYAQALQSVLLSCDLREGNLCHRASARRIASVHVRTPRNQNHIY